LKNKESTDQYLFNRQTITLTGTILFTHLGATFMNDEINYKNNPLHGLGLKSLLTEIVDHYGFEILFAYLNINCFKINPSIDSSVKFLKKTDWAREKVEVFYLYESLLSGQRNDSMKKV